MAPGAGGRAGLLWWPKHLVAPVGPCVTMPARVPLGSSLQPFRLAVPWAACASELPVHSVAASPQTPRCLFPDAYRCFLVEGTDRWLQAVE